MKFSIAVLLTAPFQVSIVSEDAREEKSPLQRVAFDWRPRLGVKTM